MDDDGLAMIENILKLVVLKKGVGVVRGEALFSAGSFGEIPEVGDGRGGHAAEEAGELPWGAEAGVFLVDELAD